MFTFMPKTRDYVEYKIINGVTQETDSTEHICSNSICSNSICEFYMLEFYMQKNQSNRKALIS